jgi:hypothetical protein
MIDHHEFLLYSTPTGNQDADILLYIRILRWSNSNITFQAKRVDCTKIRIQEYHRENIHYNVMAFWPEDSRRFVNVVPRLTVNSVIFICGVLDIDGNTGM